MVTPQTITTSQLKSTISLFDGIKEGDVVVFISYAWDNEEHKRWVKKLSDDLRTKYGIYTLLDQYLPGGVNLINFMLLGITRYAHKVLVVGSPRYKEKIDSSISGGVLFEDQIMTIELYKGVCEKYIPILRIGTFQTSFSDLMSTRSGYDFTDESKYEQHLMELAYDLKGHPLNAAPQLGRNEDEFVVSTEEEMPSCDWKKIFEYSILLPSELENTYNVALSKISDNSLSMNEFAHLVFTLCEMDNNGIKLTEKSISDIKASLYSRLDSAFSYDDLYELKIIYGQMRNSCCVGHVDFESLNQINVFYCKTIEKLEKEKRWKLVRYLEEITDENVTLLVELLNHAPDHGTPYSSLPLFDKVNAESFIDSIKNISPKALLELRKFFIERYKLVYRLMEDNNSFAFTDDIKCLSQILEGIKAHIEVLPQYERLPYIKLAERINQSISRCKGDKSAFEI